MRDPSIPLMSTITQDKYSYSIRRTSESSVAVEVFKTGLMGRRKHILFVETYGGMLEYDFDNPERSRAELEFDANSIVCRDEWLSPEKRKEFLSTVKGEMLKVSQYPKITFSSGKIRKLAQHRFEVDGTLTIRGIAKPVTAEVAAIPVGKVRFELDITARIKFSDYGMERPSAMMGLIGTRDEMRLRCLLFPERKESDA